MKTTSATTIFGMAKIIAGDSRPESYALEPVRPNPFNPSCEIPFALPEDGRVTISIYDLSGHKIAQVADADYVAGEHSIRWNGVDDSGREMPAGIYFCRMNVGSFVATRRMLLVK